MTTSTRLKKIRSQPPDITVAVGSGSAMEEFECYKIVLSFASPYFDTMLTTNMAENNSHRIEFPKKDPEEWKEFYKFIDPTKISAAKHDIPTLSKDNAMKLTPWFHEFQIDSCLKECDEVISKKVEILARRETTSNDPKGWYGWKLSRTFWDKQSGYMHDHHNAERRQTLNEIINLLQFACLYDLDKTKKTAECVLDILLYQMPAETSELFDLSMIKVLVDLFLPIRFEGKVGSEEQPIDLKAEGQSHVLWNVLTKYDRFSIKNGYSPEVLNNNPLLPMLIQTEIQRYAACCENQRTRYSVQNIINDYLANLPSEFESQTSRENISDPHQFLDGYTRSWYQNHKKFLQKLGISLSYPNEDIQDTDPDNNCEI